MRPRTGQIATNVSRNISRSVVPQAAAGGGGGGGGADLTSLQADTLAFFIGDSTGTLTDEVGSTADTFILPEYNGNAIASATIDGVVARDLPGTSDRAFANQDPGNSSGVPDEFHTAMKASFHVRMRIYYDGTNEICGFQYSISAATRNPLRVRITSGGTAEARFMDTAASVFTVSEIGLSAGWHVLDVYYNHSTKEVGLAVNDGVYTTTTMTNTIGDVGANFKWLLVGWNQLDADFSDGGFRFLHFIERTITDEEKTTLYNSGTPLEYPFV